MASTNLHERLALVIEDWAKFERAHEKERLAIARINHPHLIVPCEGCGKVPVVPGGLCPACLEIAAGACRRCSRSK